MRACALSNTQSATALPLRPGRVLPRMIPIFNSRMAVLSGLASLEHSCHRILGYLNVQVSGLDFTNGAIPQAGCRRHRYRPEMVDAGTTPGVAGSYFDARPATHGAGSSAATGLPTQLHRVLRARRPIRSAQPHDADERARSADQRRALAVVT